MSFEFQSVLRGGEPAVRNDRRALSANRKVISTLAEFTATGLRLKVERLRVGPVYSFWLGLQPCNRAERNGPFWAVTVRSVSAGKPVRHRTFQ
jgi:hypothetical protein